MPLGRISPWLPKATVAVEDRRFYSHGGVDYEGIARALWRTSAPARSSRAARRSRSSSSRNLYIGRERTFERKLKEACLAIKLSRALVEGQQILREYLNTVYYGNHAYGVEAASQTYFNRHASQLKLRQAALLAGLPQAPSVYDPFHNPKAAIARRNEVLQTMLADGRDHAGGSTAARGARDVQLEARPDLHADPQPYFFSYVIDELERVYGANTVREGGLRVYTTIDPRLQRAAKQAIRETLNYSDDPAAAIVSVEPGTGAIRAMARSSPATRRTSSTSPRSRRGRPARRSRRSCSPPRSRRGSTRTRPTTPRRRSRARAGRGARATTRPASRGRSRPTTTTTSARSRSPRATLRSDNTVYAQLTLDVGPDYVWRMAKRLGVNLTQKPVASIGLGPLAVSPLDMAAAYATFASGGIYAKPTGITEGRARRTGRSTATPAGASRDAKRALSEGVAWKVNDVLGQNALYGTGSGSRDGVHPNAGKTGTTEDHADAWFVGYTRDLSTAVWMGYPSGEIPMLSVHGQAVAGATFPVPIWHRYMAAAEWREAGARLPRAEARARLPAVRRSTTSATRRTSRPTRRPRRRPTTATTPTTPATPAAAAGRADAEAGADPPAHAAASAAAAGRAEAGPVSAARRALN